MPDLSGIKVLFVAGFGPISADPAASKKLYVDTLKLPLEAMPHDPTYFHGEGMEGVKHFAIWPLKSAAEAVFGKGEWPKDVPTPTSWIEFDVEDIAAATAALKAQGYKLLVEAREEPWGQTVTRMISPEGLLLGLTITPWLRK
jgi:catechol 2,3-dioxygenase-like lactoylglutathione lyase family enzyme